MMKPFFLVLARDKKYVDEKIEELKNLGVPYLIVCGEKLNHLNVIYRRPMGKYDLSILVINLFRNMPILLF